MPNPNRQSKPPIHKSEQQVQNWSFDEEFNVLATEGLVFNPTTNALDRATQFTAGSQFDYIGITNDSATQDTLTYKNGGSGGTTVRTLVITYAAGASKISDDLASLDYS